MHINFKDWADKGFLVEAPFTYPDVYIAFEKINHNAYNCTTKQFLSLKK